MKENIEIKAMLKQFYNQRDAQSDSLDTFVNSYAKDSASQNNKYLSTQMT